jgi:hypothetical protein
MQSLPAPSPVSAALFRLEFVGVGNHQGYREYHLRVLRQEGVADFRFKIATAAFGAARLPMQDGPDLCYQKLQRALVNGDTLASDVITIGEEELARYREAHISPQKRRVLTATAFAPMQGPPRPPKAPAALVPAAAPMTTIAHPAYAEGQRVQHAVFGEGVIAACDSKRTVVWFDRDGEKTFVTSLVELSVLSAPHTWQTTTRGKNRLLPAPAALG